MGARFELVLQGSDRPRLRAAGEAAIDVIETDHRRFSRFDPGSLVNHLRRVGGGSPVPVDDDTWDLFTDAVAVRRGSGGIFDPTRGTGGTGGGIELDPSARTVRLTSPAVEVDFGAIAKGHTLDRAARVLRDAGIERGFLHGGTSSGYGIGRPAGGAAWRIAAGTGAGSDAVPRVELVDRAFSMSMQGGARQVLVAGPSGRLADAWATAAALGAVTGTLPEDMEAWVRPAGGAWGTARPCVGAVR